MSQCFQLTTQQGRYGVHDRHKRSAAYLPSSMQFFLEHGNSVRFPGRYTHVRTPGFVASLWMANCSCHREVQGSQSRWEPLR